MSLDLSTLTVKTDVALPEARRGRTAEPVPANILDAVKRTYSMEPGKGGSIRVPNGETTESGSDSNVSYLVGQLRKAARELGYGLSVKVMEPGKASTEVLFRAKDKAARRTADEKRHDDLIAAWVEAEATEYDGDEDDDVALAAWEAYIAL